MGGTWFGAPLGILKALLAAQTNSSVPLQSSPLAALCPLERHACPLRWWLGTEGHLGRTDRAAAGHLLGKRMGKEKQRHLQLSKNSLGGFAERLIGLGTPLSSGTPRGWVCPSPSAARPGGRSRGAAAKTCMRTCAKINARAHELMIARRIDAACPARAVLLTSTSSGSAGRAGDILLQPFSISSCSCSPCICFAFAHSAA